MAEESHAYLPYRITSGSIEPQGLSIQLKEKTELFLWDSIQLVCLGIVEERLFEVQPTIYAYIKNRVSKFFATGEEHANENTHRRKIYVEIFIRELNRPLRMESSAVNYRSFLGSVEYNSTRNLRKFLGTLTQKMPAQVFDRSYSAYLKDEKDPALVFPNVYEFQRHCQEQLKKGMEKS